MTTPKEQRTTYLLPEPKDGKPALAFEVRATPEKIVVIAWEVKSGSQVVTFVELGVLEEMVRVARLNPQPSPNGPPAA